MQNLKPPTEKEQRCLRGSFNNNRIGHDPADVHGPVATERLEEEKRGRTSRADSLLPHIHSILPRNWAAV